MSIKDPILAINGGSPVRSEIIPIHKPVIQEDDINAVSEALRTTFISGDGPKCREFENMLAKYLGVKHAFYLVSCTAALDLAFMIKGFPPGSEVIVPNFTYTSTALGPILNNLKVILVDVYDYNGNIDVSKIEAAITNKTVAIVPVDYAGNPVDMDGINEIARKYNLYVVHDTAQSLGATYKGKKTGSLANVSCFSFHGTKNLITGEGGAIVTDDDELAAKIKIAREKGTDKHTFIDDPQKKGFYEYVSIGNSYVQSNILGALGVTQLNKIEWISQRRKEIAAIYNKEFKDIKGIKLPTITEGAVSNWHLFYLLVPSELRFWLIDALKAEGVSSNVHYNPLHLNLYYKDMGSSDNLNCSVRFYEQLIRIPIYPDLTDNEVKDIVAAVKKIFSVL